MWISRPSAALVITISGFTCASIGKPGRDVGKTIFCGGAAPLSRAIFHTPTDCGMFQLALSVARYLPDASGAGYVSTPSPVVICTGVPPRDRHGPDVAPLDILGVGAVVERLAVGREGDRRLIFDEPVGGGQQHGTRGRHP